MKNTRKFFFVALGLLITSFFVFGDTSILKAQSTVSEMDGYAWANTNDAGVNGPGWIYFKDPYNDPATWQVTIDASGNLNGYAWANPVDTVTGEKNFGWVKFGGLSGFPSGSGTVASNATLAGNNIIGWARFCSATQNTLGTNIPGNCSAMTDNPNGGWDGWISFQGDAMLNGVDTGSYGVTVGPVNAQGQRFLSGFAWGGPINVGWVDMSQVFINQSNNGKSQMTFTASTTGGNVTATKQTPIVSGSTNSGVSPNVTLSWNILEVTNCMASGDWVPLGSFPNRNSTNGNHVWTGLTFTNTTTSVITKSFILTCQGDENSTGTIVPITRQIIISILPGGNVASVVVNANPNTVFPTGTTNISWTSNKINPGSCVGSSTFNGTPLVSPLWTGSQTGTNGYVAPVSVAGFATGDSTIYKLTCTKVLSASGTPCPGDPVNTVCGYDTVSIGEGADLILQAYKDGYTTAVPTPMVSSVNPGEKVSLVWKSISGKQLRCSSVPGTGATVTSPTFNPNWIGGQGDVMLPSLENFKNGVEVLDGISIYNLVCADVTTNLPTNMATAIVNITGGLNLSLIATDKADGDSNVVEGGLVKIDVKALVGSVVGACSTTTIGTPSPVATSWNTTTATPGNTYNNITLGGATNGYDLEYSITCTDSLTLQPVTASDSIHVVKGVSPLVNVDLTPTDSCIAPGEDFALQVTSASVLPAPVGTDNNFVSCTTTGPGSNAWNNFPNGFLNSLNVGGGAVFNIDYSDHNTPSGSSVSYSITCEDSSGTQAFSSTMITVDDDGCIAPPGGGGSGNIKPIIIEQ